ncbi:MAG: TonB-dependent receptor [Saprospiraceae bacterium]|nr:TonB-dependent receptor [Saprospiraceae bacterium]
MKKIYKFLIFNILCALCIGLSSLNAQTTIRGKVVDAESGEELIGAAIAVVKGGAGGAVTNYEGEFSLKVDAFPATLKISYTGYATQERDITSDERVEIRMSSSSIIITEAVIRGQRIDDKQKAAPLTVENLDAIAIKETAAVSFYNGLGNLKGVDMTTASLGFTVINMRGFNSTSPVRSLQIIDGVDNQAPGLNFSLGNFLGSSELDVNKVDLVVGASSAFYGPNAFNGVISMESKNPFLHRGLSVSLKTGERNLLEGAFRFADAIKNKAGHPVFAYKLNFFGLRADDWVADNYDPISEAEGNQFFTAAQNPGGWNAVNIYGDEYAGRFTSTYDARAGLNSFHRQGYKEIDVVDYDTKNVKAGIALHFRLNPAKEFESPELILASNYGTGTTVYQGDNRFSLRGIQFYQNRIELRKKDKYFIRLYSTNEDAGRSYDPYFTSLKMLEASKTNQQWQQDYEFWWVRNDLGAVFNKMKAAGYGPPDNFNALQQWQQDNIATLTDYHQQAQAYANLANASSNTVPYFEPGTARYDSLFDAITSRKNNSTENGTLFYDKSALYHAHGEYRFKPKFLNEWVVGANVRLYRPSSDGTIFSDSLGAQIKNSEWGAYTGIEKQVGNFKFSATVRVDKNKNFDYLATPAASIVWTPRENNYLRVSFSSAIRNPTLTDQYLNLRVGPATLIGNLNGFDSLITLESFNRYRDNTTVPLDYLNIDPIRPEKVKTFELGYRTTLFNRIYVDAGYYYNIYNDFIGYNIGLTLPFERTLLFPPDTYIYFPVFQKLKVYRVASNASQTVTSQGIAIGLNYYFLNYFMVQGNYSWNKLNTAETDPIVPAFNTPEHKFNLGFSGRDIKTWGKNTFGFNINYKWIDNFTFEGSPQFTGLIPSYELLDAQVNMNFPKIHSTIKLGASNLLNNKQFQTYGGPRIGRMAYLSLVYDFREK